jgi:hypothetical protein
LLYWRRREKVPSAPGGANAVCDKCNEIDDKIERYRRFAQAVPNPEFVDRLNALIKDLEQEKAALHPEDGSV